MLKNIDPSDKSIKPFKAHKNFTLTQNSSGSGHYFFRAVSGSTYNFTTGSATSQSFGIYDYHNKKYSLGTFYDIPNFFMIKNRYYENNTPYRTFGSNDYTKIKKVLNGAARILSVPKDLFGERIKPHSIDLEVTTQGNTYNLRDDGDGNIYDNAHSASFAAYKSSSFDYNNVTSNGSGSQVGNVFYDEGLIILTDTGSLRQAIVDDNGTIYGHTLKYKATHTIYEHEYVATVEPNEYNISINNSLTQDLSGSLTIAKGSKDIHLFFPPGDQPSKSGTGSFNDEYNATDQYASFVTHSEFRPYVTNIGLYNDKNELLVIGKLAKPIKLSQDTTTSFVVRFDV